MHFGHGGLIDHILCEITWLESFGQRTDFLGRHKAGEGGYPYESPGYWWQFVVKRFDTSNLKRNLVIR